LWSCHVNVASAREADSWRLSSSGSVSLVAVPSSTRPMRGMAPALNSSASARVVLPDPPWPTRATFRILAEGTDAMRASFP